MSVTMRERERNALDGVRFSSLGEKSRIEHILMERARRLVAYVNETAGEALLYLTECASVWMLFGRPDEMHMDKLLMHGFTDAEDLARLVIRLEREVLV